MHIRATEVPGCRGAGSRQSDISCKKFSVRVGSGGWPGVVKDAPRAALGLSGRVVLYRGSETSDVFCVSFSSISKKDLPRRPYFVHPTNRFHFPDAF